MMGPGSLCYIQKFMEISLLVQEKIFEVFLPYIYGRGSHLGQDQRTSGSGEEDF